jgi:Drought induced 19 protein (Di19).
MRPKKKRFCCPYCDKSFPLKSSRNTHISRNHRTENKERVCFICGKLLLDSPGLKCERHKKTVLPSVIIERVKP